MTADDLKNSLNELGWTGAELSRRTGVIPGTISRWMQGHVPVPGAIAELIRVSLLAKEILDGPYVGK